MATTYCGQFLDVVIGSPQTGQPQLLGKLCERRVSEQRHVTQQLVTYVTAKHSQQKQLCVTQALI